MLREVEANYTVAEATLNVTSAMLAGMDSSDSQYQAILANNIDEKRKFY